MNPDNRFSVGFHDARWERSQNSLREAILLLASEKSVSTITAQEVATMAELNRSTFYKHAKNPADLLRAALGDELVKIREQMIVDLQHGDRGSTVRRAVADVLSHVAEYRLIYSRAFGESDDSGLHKFLSEHIEETFRIVFENGIVALPFVDDEAGTGARFTARFIAHGTAGAIDAWLADSEELSIDDFLARFAYQLPSWWPAA